MLGGKFRGPIRVRVGGIINYSFRKMYFGPPGIYQSHFVAEMNDGLYLHNSSRMIAGLLVLSEAFT